MIMNHSVLFLKCMACLLFFYAGSLTAMYEEAKNGSKLMNKERKESCKYYRSDEDSDGSVEQLIRDIEKIKKEQNAHEELKGVTLRASRKTQCLYLINLYVDSTKKK